jgi:hypothetical protein
VTRFSFKTCHRDTEAQRKRQKRVMKQFLEIVPTYDRPYNGMSIAFIKSLLQAEGIRYYFEDKYSQTMGDILPLPRLYVSLG